VLGVVVICLASESVKLPLDLVIRPFGFKITADLLGRAVRGFTQPAEEAGDGLPKIVGRDHVSLVHVAYTLVADETGEQGAPFCGNVALQGVFLARHVFTFRPSPFSKLTTDIGGELDSSSAKIAEAIPDDSVSVAQSDRWSSTVDFCLWGE
jgi:hypothetical protein